MKQWPKAFTLSGSRKTQIADFLFLLLGVVGALISIAGNFFAPAQLFYVTGSSLLLITAAYFKLFYFVTLEIILLSGHGAALLEIGPTLQIAIPFLLSLQLMIFYIMSGGMTKILLFVGIIGIAALSVGFAFQNQLIFLIGSTTIAAYAFDMSFKKKSALIWALLNSFFAATSLYKLII